MGRFECINPSFLWKEVPAGRRLGAQSGVKDDADGKTFLHKSLLTRVPYPPLRGTGGMKESGKERLKQAIYESTRAPIFIKDDARRLEDTSQMSGV